MHTDDAQLCCAIRRQFGSEAVRPLEGQHTARLNPFALLKLRPITFCDDIAPCCACSNTGCNRCTETASQFAWQLRHARQQHQTTLKHLTAAPLCAAALKLHFEQAWGRRAARCRLYS
jgi:hypothetical protein